MQSKTSGQLQKYVTSMSCRLEPAIWSRDTGQQIPCFDRCQLIITWMSLLTYYLEDGRHLARLHRRCRRRAYASTSNTVVDNLFMGFFSLYGYGAFGPPELCYKVPLALVFFQFWVSFSFPCKFDRHSTRSLHYQTGFAFPSFFKLFVRCSGLTKETHCQPFFPLLCSHLAVPRSFHQNVCIAIYNLVMHI